MIRSGIGLSALGTAALVSPLAMASDAQGQGNFEQKTFLAQGKQFPLPPGFEAIPDAPCSADTIKSLVKSGASGACIGQIAVKGRTIAALKNTSQTFEEPGAARLYLLGQEVRSVGAVSHGGNIQGVIAKSGEIQILGVQVKAWSAGGYSEEPYARYRLDMESQPPKLMQLTQGPKIKGETMADRERRVAGLSPPPVRPSQMMPPSPSPSLSARRDEPEPAASGPRRGRRMAYSMRPNIKPITINEPEFVPNPPKRVLVQPSSGPDQAYQLQPGLYPKGLQPGTIRAALERSPGIDHCAMLLAPGSEPGHLTFFPRPGRNKIPYLVKNLEAAGALNRINIPDQRDGIELVPSQKHKSLFFIAEPEVPQHARGKFFATGSTALYFCPGNMKTLKIEFVESASKNPNFARVTYSWTVTNMPPEIEQMRRNGLLQVNEPYRGGEKEYQYPELMLSGTSTRALVKDGSGSWFVAKNRVIR
jgi:hypothetical protein